MIFDKFKKDLSKYQDKEENKYYLTEEVAKNKTRISVVYFLIVILGFISAWLNQYISIFNGFPWLTVGYVLLVFWICVIEFDKIKEILIKTYKDSNYVAQNNVNNKRYVYAFSVLGSIFLIIDMLNIQSYNYENPLITIYYLLALAFVMFIKKYIVSEKNGKNRKSWQIFLCIFGVICLMTDLFNLQNHYYEFPWITICYLFPSVFIGFITEYIAKKKGVKYGFLWGFLLSFLGTIIVTFFMDENNKRFETVNSIIKKADAIKKYKELLDMGVITQEEFESKKKKLLK